MRTLCKVFILFIYIHLRMVLKLIFLSLLPKCTSEFLHCKLRWEEEGGEQEVHVPEVSDV
jgi:hypothetical protein